MIDSSLILLDPAYPPDRQNIYLSVAVPRGIILLKRTGTLHPSVRTYIQENLKIKCEIPALEIADNGFLRGGDVVGCDVFDSIRNADDVNVVIGPDSIGTLSFTSGSTGIPKGKRKNVYSNYYHMLTLFVLFHRC